MSFPFLPRPSHSLSLSLAVLFFLLLAGDFPPKIYIFPFFSSSLHFCSNSNHSLPLVSLLNCCPFLPQSIRSSSLALFSFLLFYTRSELSRTCCCPWQVTCCHLMIHHHHHHQRQGMSFSRALDVVVLMFTSISIASSSLCCKQFVVLRDLIVARDVVSRCSLATVASSWNEVTMRPWKRGKQREDYHLSVAPTIML